MTSRKLSLKREVLADLADADLRLLAGGTTKTTVVIDDDTLYSCMPFESCRIPFCHINDETLLQCLVN